MDWLDTGAGRSLQVEENRQVKKALDGIFGDQFLQIGKWGRRSFREYSRTQRTAVVDRENLDGVDFRSALDCIAVADDSIDVAVLPHVLETHEDPHGVLREVDRILRSDGHVIVLGFNPVSIWGLRHLLSRKRFPAGIQRMISEHRLRDWLRLLNFSAGRSSIRYFRTPMFRRKRVWPEDRNSAWGRYAPFAGCYMLVARKELYTVTPIRPAWGRRTRMVGRLVNPTTRNAA
jgi:SAM-dependent methyltransferase